MAGRGVLDIGDPGFDLWREEQDQLEAARRQREAAIIPTFLQANPWEAYLGAMPKERPQQAYWLQQYDKIRNQWLAGETTKFKSGGLSPAMGQQAVPFYKYIEKYPWLQEYYGTPREERGQGYPSRYSPPARWLMY